MLLSCRIIFISIVTPGKVSYQNKKNQLLDIKAKLNELTCVVNTQQWKASEKNDSVNFWLFGDEKSLKLIQEHLDRYHIEAQLKYTAEKKEPLLILTGLVSSELLSKIPKLQNPESSLIIASI